MPWKDSRNGLYKPFLYADALPEHTPEPLILSSKKPSVEAPQGTKRNAYARLGATLVAGLALTSLLAIFAVFPPRLADAFWLFSSTKAADDTDPPILHDSTITLLEAAVNPDPNPTKGGIDIAISGGSALVAESGPDGTLPESVALGTGGPVNDQISLYVVREGDSLSDIAGMFGVSVNTILWANDLRSAKDIHEGDSLLILPVSGVRHTVLKGQTLAGIAKKYDADIDEIAVYNGLDTSAALAAGDEIIIPGGDLAPAPTTTKKPTSSSSGAVASKKPTSSVSLGDWANPVPGAYVSQGIHGNNGVDLAGIPSGTPVYAVQGGTVIVAKADGGYNGGYGNYVVIRHSNGTQTLYAHLSSVATSVGATVAKGEHIGGVGSTGRSTGNHLHFEVRGAANPFAR